MVIILKDGKGVLFIDQLKKYVEEKHIQKIFYEQGLPAESLSTENIQKVKESISEYFTDAIDLVVEKLLQSYALGTDRYATQYLNSALSLISATNSYALEKLKNNSAGNNNEGE